MPPKAAPQSASTSASSASSSLKHQSVGQQLTKLATSQQFYWYLGHVFALLFTVFSAITGLIYRKQSSLKYYRFALLSIITTYLIVLKQVYFKNTGLKNVTVARLLRDENVQYIILAAIFLVSSFISGDQVPAGLYSYSIFAVFHVLTYFQNQLLPVLVPSLTTQQKLSSRIGAIINKFNQPALYVAAAVESSLIVTTGLELILLPFAILLRWRSFGYAISKIIVFVSVVVFNKLRYDNSQFTKAIVNEMDKNQAGFVTRLNNPKVTLLYNNLRAKAIYFLQLIQLPKEVKKTQ